MFYLLLGLNLIYVIAEFSYNAFLLTSLSGPYPDVEKLELLGRILSSFGATFIFYKIINTFSIKLRYKILSMFICSLIIYPTVYIGQKELVDYLANSTTLEQRQKYQDLYVIRKGWANGALKVDSLPDFESSVSNNVIYNVFGFLNNSNEDLLNEYNSNKHDVLKNVLKQEMIYNIDYSYSVYKKIEEEIKSAYNEYRKLVKNNYIDELNRNRVEAEKYYTQLKENEGSIYRQQYYDLRVLYNKSKKLIEEYIETTYGQKYLVSISDTLNMDSLKALNEKYKIEQQRLINIFVQNGISENNFRVYDYFDFCTMQSGRGIDYIARKNIEGKAYSNNFVGWNNHLSRSYRMVCNVGDLQQEYNRILNIVNANFKKEFGLLNFNYNSKEELVSDPNFVRWIANQSGFEIEHNIRYDSMNNFVEDYIRAFEVLAKNKVQEEIKNKYLIEEDISLNISNIQEFIENRTVVKILESQGLSGIDGFKVGLDKEEFSSSFAYNMLDIQISYFENIDLNHYEAVDLVKMMLIPSFALFLSIFFGLINLVILVKSMFNIFIKHGRAKNILNIFCLLSVLLIIFVPMFIEFPFVDKTAYLFIDNSLNADIKLYLTKWLFNIEAILFELIKLF